MSETIPSYMPTHTIVPTYDTDEFTSGSGPYDALLYSLTLRAIVKLRLLRKAILSTDCGEILGRLGCVNPESDDAMRAQVWNELTTKLKSLELAPPRVTDGPLIDNVQWLGNALGLNSVEREIIVFIVLLNSDEVLSDTISLMGSMDLSRIDLMVANVTGLPIMDVTKAFRADGLLVSSGLVNLDGAGSYRIRNKLALHSDFKDQLLRPFEDKSEMLRAFFRPAPAPLLDSTDFEHVQREYQFLREYLARARSAGTQGVNILIYGPPGTGKTMLARTLCSEIGTQLFEVASESTEHKPLDRDDRFAAYRFAQCFLSKGPSSFVLFDEIEDVFTSGLFGHEKIYKAWLNRLLESNAIPAFWISNSIEDMDNAYLRRFDYILELDIPGQKIRKKILRNYFGETVVTEPWLDHIAKNDDLAPAHTERIARVAKVIASGSVETTEEVAQCMLATIMRVTGGAAIENRQYKRSPLPYDLSAVNTDHNLSNLITGLARDGYGRLCLFGPPGTGKTAFGHHLAAQISRPVHNVPASTLLSKYQGDTEKNLARVFKNAKRDGAVILLDEADSFLQARAGAQHSWEVTMVNELLVQLEKFEGVLVASTNLLESVDSAAMRRFDFKIKFDYLNRIQRATLFKDALPLIGIKDVEAVEQHVWLGLARLNVLTPGDYASCVRRLSLLGGETTPETLLEALKAECDHKPAATSKPIGFMH